LSFGFLFNSFSKPDWGFFGHRKINRMAVFTLPTPVNAFFKENIEYLTDHAVDPDKRRYATKHEAVRHYIDIDHWEEYPFDTIPRNFTDALIKYSDVLLIDEKKDTFLLFGKDEFVNVENGLVQFQKENVGPLFINQNEYRKFIFESVMPLYYEDEWKISCEDYNKSFSNLEPIETCTEIKIVDHFSEYGILPYHLLSMQNRLTKAFQSQNKKSMYLCILPKIIMDNLLTK